MTKEKAIMSTFREKDQITLYKPTDDDWYGNETIIDHDRYGKISRLVCVSFYNALSNGDMRVCVWGNDDYGMEKDYKNLDQAVFEFRQIIEMPRVSKQLLKDMGFVTA